MASRRAAKCLRLGRLLREKMGAHPLGADDEGTKLPSCVLEGLDVLGTLEAPRYETIARTRLRKVVRG